MGGREVEPAWVLAVKAKRTGRPPVDRPTGRAVKVYMLPDVEQKAREIGGGNLSAGVATAVRKHRLALGSAEGRK